MKECGFMKVLSIFFVVLACGFSSQAQEKVLNIGISSEFENLNPMIGTQAATKYMLYLAHRPMVILSIDGKWEPLLIKQIPTTANKMVKKKGEGLEVTVEIVDWAQWGDGVPVTCKDMILSWKVGMSKTVSIANREPYENIGSIDIDKANPKKCVVYFKKSKFDYFANLPDLLPEHLEGPIFEKHKDQSEGYDRNSLYTKNPTNPGLYFGPYVISEVKLGSHLIFSENPKYGGQKPQIKKIIIKLLPNNATMEANLRSGNINAVSSAGGLGHDQATELSKKTIKENLPFQVNFTDGVIYAHIDINLDHPALKDLRVRKALSHAFNKKEMIASFLEGGGAVAHHFVVQSDPWYTENVQKYEFNRRESVKLLDEAGWKLGSGGFREKDGKKLSLNLKFASGAKVNEMITAYLQDKFKAIGVELLLKGEPSRVFFGETTTKRNFDLALFSWMSIPEQTPRSILHSSMIPSKENSWAGQNFTGYKNQNVDKWIDQLEQELDAKKRAELGQKILNEYTKDIPVIPLYYRQSNSVTPKSLKNYRLSGHIFYETLYAEKWTLQ